MSMWDREEMQETKVPDGAAFSMNGRAQSVDADVIPASDGAYEMALAAFALAGAALSLALFVYLTRGVSK